eukprot:GHVS01053608.1.p1 GENE.GHVS01053608.1~~GHVS01053608.1.p1  ORF type:complete len:490 (-),score=51.32 GHVS01053608.1:126-1595(-)
MRGRLAAALASAVVVLWACCVADMELVFMLAAPRLCLAQDTLGLTDSLRDFRRRYAFSGFEDAGFYQYAAADSNFFQQIRCRATGTLCSVHAQCCSSFCTYGKCGNFSNSARRNSLWGGRYLFVQPPVEQLSVLRQFSYNQISPSDPVMALGAWRDEPHIAEMDYPNEGDNQLRQAMNAAFGEFFQQADVYDSCWSPFLEKQFIRQAFQSDISSGTCAAADDLYPSRSDATGTFRRVFEEGVIYFGTFAEVPPFSYFVSPNKKKYWGFDAEVVRQVMGFFNRRYRSEVEVKTSFVPAQRGLFNNAADALYNGQVDIFFGKFELNEPRCAIVGCGCPYYNTGSLAIVGGIRDLRGKAPQADTEWNDSGVTIGVLADDTHIGEIAQLFPQVTLRLFWSFWDMGEHLIQGEIHGAVSDISVARFMQTMYDIHCPRCFIAKIFKPQSRMLGWAFRQFPAPPTLRQVDNDASLDAMAPLPRVYSIENLTPPATV